MTAGVLLPAILFGAVLLWRLSSQERNASERRLVYRARALADLVDGEMLATTRTLDALAASSSLDGAADLAAFHAAARRVQDTQPSWMTVILFGGGRPLVNARVRWGEALPPVVEPESLTLVLRTGRPTIGDLGRGNVRSLWAFPIRVPVVRDGATRYVLTAAVRPEAIRLAVTAGGRSADGVVRMVVDRRGRVVARTGDADVAGAPADAALTRRMASEGEGLYVDVVQGVESYVAFRRASLSGWRVAVVVPRAAVDGPLSRSRLPLLAVGLALLGASGAGALLLGRRLSRAITEAADGADALARGLDPEVTSSPIQEMDRLRESLEHSSSLLRARAQERDELLGRTEAARVEAADASRAKDEFLAILGHELRNPLAPIVTALQLMKMRGVGGERERAVIERQVKHLSRLVDDLLDVSRLAAGRVSLEARRVELRDVVASAVETATPLLEGRRHALTVDVPAGLVVTGDPVRLVQVVANLLANAAKYTDPGGHVAVRAAREDGVVALRVIDDGIGIGPELLPRVFDAFAQARQALDRAQGGLGLGLAIVKNLVVLHGGSVEVRSEGEGRGSEFVVRLPALPAQDDAGPGPAQDLAREPRKPSHRGAVLLVDDNEDAVELLEVALRSSGFEVHTALDGARALAAVESFRPDVAVLDIGLPVMDGYELARELRRRRGLERLPLIALTGYGTARDRARSSDAGFDDHLVKPVDVDALERAITAALANAAPREASAG